jgi:hypothetical protein
MCRILPDCTCGHGNHKLNIHCIKSDNTKNKTVMTYSTHDYKCARVVCMLKKLCTLKLKIARYDKPHEMHIIWTLKFKASLVHTLLQRDVCIVMYSTNVI